MTKEATWEDVIKIKSKFPKFVFVDRVFGSKGGMVESATSE